MHSRGRSTAGKTSKDETLLSTIDSPAIDKRIQAAAKAYFPKAERIDTFFEHGHWWARVEMGSDRANELAFGREDAPTFDVVDAEGGRSIDGFDFEALG